MKAIILLIVLSVLVTSCYKQGKIKVENRVHNSKLDNISFGDVSVYSSLLPGQTSDEVMVKDKKESFPLIRQLEFYMEANGNMVYLKTKYSYTLNSDETLLITISDTTELINPLIK